MRRFTALMLGAALSVPLLLLSGCDNKNLTHVKDAYNHSWEEVVSGELKNEKSHMATPPAATNQDNPAIGEIEMAEAAPVAIVEEQSLDDKIKPPKQLPEPLPEQLIAGPIETIPTETIPALKQKSFKTAPLASYEDERTISLNKNAPSLPDNEETWETPSVGTVEKPKDIAVVKMPTPSIPESPEMKEEIVQTRPFDEMNIPFPPGVDDPINPPEDKWETVAAKDPDPISEKPAATVPDSPKPAKEKTKPVSEEPKFIPVVDEPRTKGLNPKNLFGKALDNDTARVDRLERAVQDMRDDFDMVEPSVHRLMALEGDIQKLVTELEEINEGAAVTRPAAAAKPPKATPAPLKKEAEKQPEPNAIKTAGTTDKKVPPPTNGKASVYDLRVGEHPDKTRIVMDVNAQAAFAVDLDNSEKIMVVELPNAGWTAAMSQSFAKSPYITSYTVEPAGDGQMVIFQLKKNANVGYKADLKGLEGNSRRIVIDVTG